MFKKYLDIAPEVKEALESGKPVVALESTIITHGFPYPENQKFAKDVEAVVRAEGAVPATIAIIDGRIKVGLSEAELLSICDPKNVGKLSRRDIAACVALGKSGATTVASTMILAHMAGIKVYATGGIGGVHRGGEDTMDISADLQELATTPMAVVCAGAKQILDIGRTLEYLETMGVPVLGYETEWFPAFYARSSGYKADYRCDGPEECAKLLTTHWELGLKGGIVVGTPIPEEYALDFDEMETVITEAVKMAQEQGIKGKNTTPFLLARIKELTKGVASEANVQLAFNNARVASRIAKAMCEL